MNEVNEAHSFQVMILLDQPHCDWNRLRQDLAADWEIPEESWVFVPDLLILDSPEGRVSVSLQTGPVEDEDLEYYAQLNYLWREAPERVQQHQAALVVSVRPFEQALLAGGILLVKVAASCCRQSGVLGVCANSTVYQPELYQEEAKLARQGELPLGDLVWFGVYLREDGVCGYTSGMLAYGYEEMEILDSEAEPEEVRDFLFSLAAHVLEGGVGLREGETVGFEHDTHRYAISKNAGVALEGETLKIAFKVADSSPT